MLLVITSRKDKSMGRRVIRYRCRRCITLSPLRVSVLFFFTQPPGEFFISRRFQFANGRRDPVPEAWGAPIVDHLYPMGLKITEAQQAPAFGSRWSRVLGCGCHLQYCFPYVHAPGCQGRDLVFSEALYQTQNLVCICTVLYISDSVFSLTSKFSNEGIMRRLWITHLDTVTRILVSRIVKSVLHSCHMHQAILHVDHRPLGLHGRGNVDSSSSRPLNKAGVAGGCTDLVNFMAIAANVSSPVWYLLIVTVLFCARLVAEAFFSTSTWCEPTMIEPPMHHGAGSLLDTTSLRLVSLCTGCVNDPLI